MAKPNLIFAAVIFICLTLHGATSFSLNQFNAARTQQPTTTKNILQSSQQLSLNDETASQPIRTKNHLQQSLLAGCTTFLTMAPLSAFAAADELEIAELPPVYVPILFAIAIIGGVGVLTFSLGNVMDEGTCTM